eukprot:scaffold61018_cov52-Cyclotella_meneghiniana.AAC.5
MDTTWSQMTDAKFITDNVLVTSTNEGIVRIWYLPLPLHGKVCLWSTVDDVNAATPGKKFCHLTQNNSANHIGNGYNVVTDAKFITDNVLVTSTNEGIVRIWYLPLPFPLHGKVRLWSTVDDVNAAAPGKKFCHLTQNNSANHIGNGYNLVTDAKFITDNVLVTSTNQGIVRIWYLPLHLPLSTTFCCFYCFNHHLLNSHYLVLWIQVTKALRIIQNIYF